VIPGPRSKQLADALRHVESPGVTTLGGVGPIFWDSAAGSTVVDVDGNEYVDLTAAFGVAAVGHSNERVAEAISSQAQTMLHGMGDVYPPRVKVKLLEALARVTPGDLNQAILGLNGADAVEAALKCAVLVTGKPGVIAFEGAYHGLGGGALSVTSRSGFRTPFGERWAGPTTFVGYPRTDLEAEKSLRELERVLSFDTSVGALIIEPIQGRGGVVVPPDGFLASLRALCNRFEALLIVDEIFTGLGRTGEWFAVNREKVVPDLLCVGKALGGGMPLSACVGGPTSIGQWPEATGEALHTSTFLGHPGSCAAALASLCELRDRELVGRARRLGAMAMDALADLEDVHVRGRGLMIGIEMESGTRAARVVAEALQRGVLLLPSGPEGEVISITPPLVIEEDQLMDAIAVLKTCVRLN
jgi:4-aminobutyrate aminotransferase-like enzyme